MLKRIVSAALALLFCFSVSGITNKVSAEKKEQFAAASVGDTSSNTETGYISYRQGIASDHYATENLIMDSPVETTGNVAEDGVQLTENGQYIVYSAYVSEDGWYQPSVYYQAIEDQGNSIEIAFQIDGEYPYSQLSSVLLNRAWVNAYEEFASDKKGNQYSPEQKETFIWQTSSFRDVNGFINDMLLVWLTKGEHKIKLILNSEKVKVGSVALESPEVIITDEEYRNLINSSGYKQYSGNEIVIEGENADLKSSRFIAPLANRNSAIVKPADPYKKVINYIGGSNWKSVGDTLTWNFEVKEDGLYNIGFCFHQTYLQESVSYRTVRIDGKIPYESAKSVEFKYDDKWQITSLGDKNGAIPVYLTAGTHEISMTVTLGALSDFSEELKALVSEIGTLYRQIVMITGDSPDSNRDYDLFNSLPDLGERLTYVYDKLEKLAVQSEEIAGSKGGSTAQLLRKMSLTVSQMLKEKYKAQNKLSSYNDNYASLASWLYEMQNMALDLDCIILSSPEKNYKRGSTSLFSSLKYSLERLVSSFADEYDVYENDSQTKSITIWSNWGMDQINALSALISSDFTPKTGIEVNLRITNATLIQANLSGNGPDLEVMLARTDPINYAMRGAVCDLSKFNGFSEVASRFSSQALTPYKYKDGVYGLPDTEIYSMLFIRTDIFEELNLTIPKTWQEFLQIAKILALHNMQAAVGESAQFFLAQKNVSLYNGNQTATNLMSSEAIEALTFWTDLYTKYNIPKTVDFFSRFRTGLVPMAIQPYSMYATLSAAAPEISGRWIMVPVPGYENEDGTISNAVVGTGNSAVILESSKNKEESWEFLKWWTSEDIQYRFSIGVESTLGISGRHFTANVAAFKKLGWDDSSIASLDTQRDQLVEFPEVPGSYYVSRMIQQVYWNVVNEGQNVSEMIKKWIPKADEEIARKISEYEDGE